MAINQSTTMEFTMKQKSLSLLGKKNRHVHPCIVTYKHGLKYKGKVACVIGLFESSYDGTSVLFHNSRSLSPTICSSSVWKHQRICSDFVGKTNIFLMRHFDIGVSFCHLAQDLILRYSEFNNPSEICCWV